MTQHNALTLGRAAIEEWLPAKMETLQGTTMRGYLGRLYKYVLPRFENTLVRDIRRKDVQAWLLSFDSAKQAKVSREVLSSILSYCVIELEALDANVALGLYKYPVSSKPNQRPLGHILTSWDEIFSYIEQIRKVSPGSNYERGCLSSFNSGLRPSETFGLDNRHISVAGGNMRLVQAYKAGVDGFELGSVKTEGSYDAMPILPELSERFKALKGERGPWMRKPNGERANPHTVSRHFKELKDRHGMLNVTFQTMRHSFATACLRGGTDVVLLQGLMRHTTSEMTMHYVHAPFLSLEQKADALLKAASKPVKAVPYEKLDKELRIVVEALAMDMKSSLIDMLATNCGYSRHEPQPTPRTDPRETLRLSNTANKVLEAIKADRYMTKAEIAQKVGVCSSTIKRAIRELREAKLVDYEGPSIGGCWTVAA